MLTLKLSYKAKNHEVIDKCIHDYTGLFYRIYNNPELMADETFIAQSLNKYIDRSIYDFCVTDVKTKLSQLETMVKNKQKQIEDIVGELENGEFVSKREKRRKFNLIKKLYYLKRTINKNICFGGKALLRNINKTHNAIKNIKTFHSENKKTIAEKEQQLTKYKQEFFEKRKLGIYLVGRACEGGNRKAKFDFENNTITFKPNKNTHIELKLSPSKKQTKVLLQLQQLANQKLIPITIRIEAQSVHISYDEEFLAGYSFNETACKSEQKLALTVEDKKEIYKKFKKEQEQRKLKNKKEFRYMSVDLNPHNIGFSIVDKTDSNGNFNVVFKENIDLSALSKKINKSSSDEKQLKQNNKRKHEIKEVWKYIFGLAIHYKVAYFVMEDLNFKQKVDENKPKEFNRKTRNIWHRTLTTSLITKYCNLYGIIKIEVNPCYSSFIGNMIYDEYDAIAASLEINRRGITKYTKGSSIYPEMNRINREKLTYLLGENISHLKETTTWIKLYRTLSLLRYRNLSKDKLKDKNLYSCKSNVVVLF
jgi:IS605 OrfB family transposase